MRVLELVCIVGKDIRAYFDDFLGVIYNRWSPGSEARTYAGPRTPILGHPVELGALTVPFMFVLILHLIGNATALTSGLVAYSVRKKKGSALHRLSGRIFGLSLCSSICCGLLLASIRTYIEGLLDSQGFSGSVNMYFVFVGLCLLDFLLQGIVIGRLGWRLDAFKFLPIINIAVGCAVWVRFGIMTELKADPAKWKMFEPFVALLSPLYMLFELSNLSFIWQSRKSPTKIELLHFHRRNLTACLCSSISILVGDVMINRFWNLAEIFGTTLVISLAFIPAHAYAIFVWLRAPKSDGSDDADVKKEEPSKKKSYGSFSEQKGREVLPRDSTEKKKRRSSLFSVHATSIRREVPPPQDRTEPKRRRSSLFSVHATNIRMSRG
mmetsp:Transcript_31156/g.54772  ORF Transcript_31156/g.54772 Transcript_31156/m.54772 type:complete len:381 (-) Transcript_31156:192-1334(-)